ncbi:TetR/AcrR family transcriptional regulator [Nocardia sp. CDC153]|uniref:TetR/AcrR family transcriptional regulator n=1 Tax=Nocardia sp. CDC153 TaxID=3112167 RepID=UPI002DBF119F|nr:TetR/AcrR family transcriptional regulator [Nocardia sp. CDC153]MEC3958341.1 TetR/AcrR family transcriptional regulator [Nocardia sp. CDC153]
MPDRPARQRQPRMDLEIRREQILDAALRLVTAHGYAATTMEAVARAADLAKPRVYAAYPGRGPLLVALFEREQRRVLDQLDLAMPTVEERVDFPSTLAAAAANLLCAVIRHPDSARLLLLPADDAPAEVREYSTRARDFARAKLRALIDWAHDHATGPGPLDPDILAVALLAVGEQLVRLTLTQPEDYPADRLIDFVQSAVARLIPTPDRRTPPADGPLSARTTARRRRG